jgi:hypothetical protein
MHTPVEMAPRAWGERNKQCHGYKLLWMAPHAWGGEGFNGHMTPVFKQGGIDNTPLSPVAGEVEGLRTAPLLASCATTGEEALYAHLRCLGVTAVVLLGDHAGEQGLDAR